MLRKKKWVLLGGLIMLAICIVVPGVIVLASGSTTVAGTVPLNIYNVVVSNITSNSAAISWDTNNPTSSSVASQVSYGVTTSYGKNVTDNTSGHHSVNISGLSSNTIYDYQIQSTATIGGNAFPATYTGSFKTLTSAPSPTTLCLISLPNPSDFGQTVYFGAAVILPNCNGIPTGTVTFKEGSTVLGTSQLYFGVAGFSTSSLSVGSHNIQAFYSGDSNYAASTSNIVVQKVHYDTTIALTSSLNPSNAGQSVTFKTTVSPNAAPGSVTFYDGATSLGSASLSSGSASISTTKLTVGYHNITAVYSGNNNYAGSTSNVVIQKVRGSTACTWPTKPSPCYFGQTCNFTVQIGVQSPGTGTPTGTITFYDGSNNIGTGSWSGSMAVLNCLLSIGSHNITAKYSGDDNFDGSTSSAVTETVNKASTTINLTSSLNPAKSGNTVTFTAKVIWSGAGTPTGTVTFKDNTTGKTLGTGTVNSSGQASCSTSSLTVTTHSIVAVYGGDTNFSGSTSSAISQVITKN